jgi:CheY-like chemotaxis protein
LNFTALVVEDDAHQRETLADLLKDEGLEVIECTTGEAAELVVASTGAELKALVTDVSLAGVELAQYAKRSIRISTSSWSPVARRPTSRRMRRFC